MSVINLPSLTLIVAPIKSGKTSLIKYLLLQHVEKLACVLLFSNTGVHAYEKNYSFLNPLYIYDSWDSSIVDRLLILGKKIRKNDPSRHIVVIFDDSVGMAKSLFMGEKAKRLLTTLRHYNISIWISTHQLQNEVPTLVRNNVEDIILFKQHEPYGLHLSFETWGKASTNLNDRSKFEQAINNLEPFHFLIYQKSTSEWSEAVIPHPLPDYRIYLHPSDEQLSNEEFEMDQQIVIYGNKQNYDLKSVEKDLSIQEIEEDDNDLFRDLELDKNLKSTEIIPDPEISDDLNKSLQLDEELYEDLRTHSSTNTSNQNALVQKNSKKRRINPTMDDDMDKSIIVPTEKLSDKDEIVKFRCLLQLRFASNNASLRHIIDSVYPGFFEDDFEIMTLKELLIHQRKMLSAFQVSAVSSSVQNQYEIMNTLFRIFVEHSTGYTGPLLNLIPQAFEQ